MNFQWLPGAVSESCCWGKGTNSPRWKPFPGNARVCNLKDWFRFFHNIFSNISYKRLWVWAGAPHLGSSSCAIDVRWVCIKMKGCSSSVCSRQTLFFHQLFPIAFNISCWGKKGIKGRKSQCLWMRFALTPHLCSTWKNLTPESLHMQEFSSSSYELLISHIGYSKSLYYCTTFDSVHHKWWICHLKEYGEKKNRKQ